MVRRGTLGWRAADEILGDFFRLRWPVVAAAAFAVVYLLYIHYLLFFSSSSLTACESSGLLVGVANSERTQPCAAASSESRSLQIECFMSQCDQDIELLKVLPLIREKRFLEFGAADGVSHSNTYFLSEYLTSWEGLCIEPNPLEFDRLVQNRPGCTHKLNIGVGARSERLTFIELTGRPEVRQLSGFEEMMSPAHLERVRRMIDEFNETVRMRVVEVRPLDEILAEIGWDRVGYFSLDCEGCEVSVLRNFDLQRVDYLTVEFNEYEKSRNTELAMLIERTHSPRPSSCSWDRAFIHRDLSYAYRTRKPPRHHHHFDRSHDESEHDA